MAKGQITLVEEETEIQKREFSARGINYKVTLHVHEQEK